ncbi:hypothetical protein MRX96_015009 [Rhipicephalus microplus]
MGSTTNEMDSLAEDIQATLSASSRSDEQEIAAYEDTGFTANNTGWKVVSSRKTNKERAETTATFMQQKKNHPSSGQVSSSRTPLNIMNRMIRASRMPSLPEDNIKIVFRPKGGLNIQKIGPILDDSRLQWIYSSSAPNGKTAQDDFTNTAIPADLKVAQP